MSNVNRTVAILVLAIATLLGLWMLISPEFTHNAPKLAAATQLKPGNPLSQFKLIDTNGKEFTPSSLRGHWTLMFFGYSSCPTICPKTLNIVKETWDKYLPTKQPPARFVFANITPLQDPTMELKSFVKSYHPRFLGIGADNPEDILELSDQLGVFQTQNTSDEQIDHTASLMLIDPNARLRAIFSPPIDPETLMQDLDVLTKR